MFGLSLLQLGGISLLVLVGASAGAYAIGYERGHFLALLDAEKVKLAAVEKVVLEARALGIAEGQITITAGQKFAEAQTKIVTRTITQIREVPVYVTKESDAACSLSNGFVFAHDRAASDPTAAALPEPARGTVDTASGVKLSDAAATIETNYNTYYKVSAQLIALQDWIKQQQALHK